MGVRSTAPPPPRAKVERSNGAGHLALAGLLLSLAGAARAADGVQLRPLCADRPGKATPACILDSGHLQLEVGVADASLDRHHGVRDDVYALGHLELRAGLARRLEAELAWSPVIVERASGGVRRSGTGDLTLSVRAALTDPDHDGISAAIAPYVSAPVATAHQGASGWQGGLLAPVAVPLSDSLSFSATPELDVVRDTADAGQHLAWTGVVGLSQAVGQGAFGVELWASADRDPAGHSTQATFDLTAAWTPKASPDLQLDAGLNAGLTHSTPGLETYVGVTRRF